MIRATVYLWPRANAGLGRLTVLIEDPDCETKSRYICWPHLPMKREPFGLCSPDTNGKTLREYDFNSNYSSYIELSLPDINKEYDEFLEAFSKTHYIHGDFSRVPRNLNKSEGICDIVRDPCSFAVMTALRCAGYFKEDTRVAPHKTPYYMMRDLSSGKVNDFVKTISAIINQDEYHIKNGVPFCVGDEPKCVEFGEKQIFNQVYLLHLINYFKKIHHQVGAQLQHHFEDHVGKSAYVRLKLLASIYSLCLLNEVVKQFGLSLYQDVSEFYNGKISGSQLHERCMPKLQEFLKKHSAREHELMLVNVLLTIVTLGIFNVVNYARSGKWMFFRLACVGRKAEKIQRELSVIVNSPF